MKKYTIAAALIAALATSPAMAQSARVPTGIDVKGETFYVLDGDKRVVQINCDTARALNNATLRQSCAAAGGAGIPGINRALDLPANGAGAGSGGLR